MKLIKAALSKFSIACGIAFLLTGCVTQGTVLTQFRDMTRSEKNAEAVRIKTQLAVEYMNARDYRAATVAIEDALKVDSGYDMAWLIRAQIYQFLKVYDKAEESFARALSISPTGAEINNNYGWYLCSIKNNANAALPYFDKALADPTYPTPEMAYLNKAICSAKLKQYGLANAYYERALNLNPEFVPVFMERARTKLEEGQYSEADRLFRIYQSRVNQLNAKALLLGWQIARANGESQAAYEYEAQLRTNYPYSEELQSISTGSTE
ncbi:type IV pilus biogenesis/stability protein PilW [Kingella kingae]|uniref:type IV pilus biogenesis/stability protein PilW n=1 Tax=Kingella kingae TaxID=504 RepID=UPI0004218017|nr:type IV pilus biogenesis/stability protein PilW [Kingella kingae]MDK4544221.1 type IV pilus biogenesis/stability protein PilW [Kingella kingae]MDK4564582.1 type IV pilus biogenesis/stability protein PilW [Kingella kingae]MDK4566638.1 type IV pilus biogenesis/stability protein PilW [Kingella kingae]MDK4578066.1 type IV pilus biogenesis/stability protein PilW [Kingella kingae]MDK4590668.1 type IV pilus biogenesis/stability protein PilW [Kingella kingae]